MEKSFKFVFQGDIQHIFKYFTDVLDVRIAFFSPQGREIIVGDNRPICEYCRLLREHFGFEGQCLELDRKMRKRAEEKGSMIVYQCHGGMNEAVTPVYLSSKLIGFVMIGQFRSPNLSMPELGVSSMKNKLLGQLGEKYSQTPCYEPRQMEGVLGLFLTLIKLVVSQRMITVSDHHPIQKLIEYMENNVEDHLSLTEAAELISCSKSTVSHMFRKATGMSFKQYQINMRLDRADEYFKSVPGITVARVAFRLGFKDPLYFSRLYHKHRGTRPGTQLMPCRE